MQNPQIRTKQTTEILQHTIAFWFNGPGAPTTLNECSEEHITKLIAEGYIEGELCTLSDDQETEYRGWWAIEQRPN